MERGSQSRIGILALFGAHSILAAPTAQHRCKSKVQFQAEKGGMHGTQAAETPVPSGSESWAVPRAGHAAQEIGTGSASGKATVQVALVLLMPFIFSGGRIRSSKLAAGGPITRFPRPSSRECSSPTRTLSLGALSSLNNGAMNITSHHTRMDPSPSLSAKATPPRFDGLFHACRPSRTRGPCRRSWPSSRGPAYHISNENRLVGV